MGRVSLGTVHTALPTEATSLGYRWCPGAAEMWLRMRCRGWRKEDGEGEEQQDGQAQQHRGSPGWLGSG